MNAPSAHALPRQPVTALLITWNERANIARTLDRLTWIDRIVAIDSGSTDGTLDILRSHVNVDVLHRAFDTFADQCNFGLAQIHTAWVLSLDADYGIPDGLGRELPHLLERADREGLAGFSFRFRYCIDGQPLRGSLLPPRTCLYRRQGAHYDNEGHGHRVRLPGPAAPLSMAILHDDRKPLERWLASQQRYLMIEADNLLTTPPSALSWADRLRRHTPLAPLAALIFCLVLRGGLLDGRAGLTYALQRSYAELLLLLLLRDQRQRLRPAAAHQAAGKRSGP